MQNQKLEANFFGSFQVLYLIKKQVYKFKLLKKKNIFQQYITKKRLVDENVIELNTGNKNSKKY